MLDAAVPWPKVELDFCPPRGPLAEPVPGVAIPRTLLAEDERRDECAHGGDRSPPSGTDNTVQPSTLCPFRGTRFAIPGCPLLLCHHIAFLSIYCDQLFTVVLYSPSYRFPGLFEMGVTFVILAVAPSPRSIRLLPVPAVCHGCDHVLRYDRYVSLLPDCLLFKIKHTPLVVDSLSSRIPGIV
ncbi:hypothetical protein AURDEDRAFT_165726 [Auricularia subglabra TFB-10046 SS5]|nr:hypothetical protein AURDEDRAFT_165726 [Auricularia subglabra TFB-10046 SS5]